jgi:hypothetical protein
MAVSFIGGGNQRKPPTCHKLLVCLMVFNTTFNNISVILWLSVLLVEETTNLSQVSYNVALSTHRHERGSNSQL